jgi:3-(3-hydroxy-phenyl)propionate hydroxylase
MDSLAPPRRWVLVDARLRDPDDARRLPPGFRYLLDPRRLTIYAHGIGENRRWEFETVDGDPDDATVLGWVSPFFDPARLEVLRFARYARLALLARRFRVGRVLLAGDAAHMMPPSAGQGLCSGVRDAVNLAWKLARVVRGASPSSLLDSYERERRAHVRGTLDHTLFLARRLEADTALERLVRGLSLRAIGALWPLRAALRPMVLPPRQAPDGFFDAASPLAGRHLPQVRLHAPGAPDADGDAAVRLDDAIGYGAALLLARDAVAPPEVLAWARARGIQVGQLERDLVETEGRLGRFLAIRDAAFALVRPDRLVFGAGALSSLPRVRAAWDAGAAAA